MKRTASMLLAMSLMVAAGTVAVADAKEVTGKVMGVYHEHVNSGKENMDQVSVTLQSCGTGKLETVRYTPGKLSEDNSMGELFNNLANSARASIQKNQYMNMVNGHASFMVNDNNTIQKTTFWGYNWECGKNIQQSASTGSGSQQMAPAAQTSPQPQAAPQSSPARGGASPIRRFGF